MCRSPERLLAAEALIAAERGGLDSPNPYQKGFYNYSSNHATARTFFASSAVVTVFSFGFLRFAFCSPRGASNISWRTGVKLMSALAVAFATEAIASATLRRFANHSSKRQWELQNKSGSSFALRTVKQFLHIYSPLS